MSALTNECDDNEHAANDDNGIDTLVEATICRLLVRYATRAGAHRSM
jgi:hypothetical protein